MSGCLSRGLVAKGAVAMVDGSTSVGVLEWILHLRGVILRLDSWTQRFRSGTGKHIAHELLSWAWLKDRS